jgi:hypothetical protein
VRPNDRAYPRAPTGAAGRAAAGIVADHWADGSAPHDAHASTSRRACKRRNRERTPEVNVRVPAGSAHPGRLAQREVLPCPN